MDIAPADQQPAMRSANKYVSKPERKCCVAREMRAHPQSNRLRMAQHNFSEKLVQIHCKGYIAINCNILGRKINHARLQKSFMFVKSVFHKILFFYSYCK
jgi:hypothetical protein